jgi:hypothetical protein
MVRVNDYTPLPQWLGEGPCGNNHVVLFCMRFAAHRRVIYAWRLKRAGWVVEATSKLKNMLSAVTIWPSGQ